MIPRDHPPAVHEDLGAGGGLLSHRILLRSGVFAGALGSRSKASPRAIRPRSCASSPTPPRRVPEPRARLRLIHTFQPQRSDCLAVRAITRSHADWRRAARYPIAALRRRRIPIMPFGLPTDSAHVDCAHGLPLRQCAKLGLAIAQDRRVGIIGVGTREDIHTLVPREKHVLRSGSRDVVLPRHGRAFVRLHQNDRPSSSTSHRFLRIRVTTRVGGRIAHYF